MLDKNKPIRYFNDVNNLAYQYYISGAVKSAVAYVSEGSGTNQLEKVMGSMSIDDSGNKRDMSAGNNFLFDRDGNMIEDKSKKMTVKYNHRGLPTEFKRERSSDENGADSVRLLLSYDGAGSRISKIRERKSAGETEWTLELATHYTGIGSEIREDAINNATKVVVNLPQGLGRYEIASASESSANTVPSFEWYLKNHLGSTMLVYGTQSTSDPTVANLGSLKAAYDYRAFGEQVDLTRYTDKVTETFTGKEKDDETELSYFGARMLDPMLGVWIAVDPSREFYHSYAYGPANPINGYDSDGRIWKTVGVRKSNVNNFFVWIGNSIGIIGKNGGATNSATAQKVTGKSFVYTGLSSPNEYISGISRDLIQECVPDEDRFIFFFFNDTATTEIYTLS